MPGEQSMISQPQICKLCVSAIGLMAIILVFAEWCNAAQAPNPATLLRQAAHRFQTEDFDTDEPIPVILLKKRPDFAEALHMLGFLRSKQQRIAESEALFQRALQVNPR